MNKILSVIVPSYNMEKYLTKALNSLVVDDQQLLQSLDVIVVNDGSKDRTSEIAHEFESRCPSVFRVIDKKNGNYGSCINSGLKVANGTYVRILDADDSYDTPAFMRYLAFLREVLERDGGPDLIFNDFDIVDEHDNVTEHTSYEFTSLPGFTLADFDYVAKPMVWAPAISYKTNIFHRIGYHQSEGLFYTDQEWDTIPMLEVRSTQYCKETVYKYLVGRVGQSVDARIKLKNFRMHIPVAIKILDEYEKHKGTTPQANLDLVANQIRFHIKMFYSNYILGYHDCLDDRELIEYDEALKKYDKELYDYTSSLSVGKFRFRYVREWRLKRTRKTFAFMLFDAYVQFRMKIKWLLGR